LESTKEKLGDACNYIDFLDKEIIELKESNDTLNEELNTKKKAYNSRLRMKRLKNSSQEFYVKYREYISLTKIIWDTLLIYIQLVFL
jgi:FtsZ-binding cell division protein ZapB